MELQVQRNMSQIVNEKYEKLKNKNRDYIIKKAWKRNILLQECLNALGSNKKVFSIEEEQEILKKFNIKLTKLLKGNRKKEFQSIQKLASQWTDESVYIIWDEEKLPIIETNFKSVLDYKDDITSIAFETWIFTVKMDKFVQFDDRNRIIQIEFANE